MAIENSNGVSLSFFQKQFDFSTRPPGDQQLIRLIEQARKNRESLLAAKGACANELIHSPDSTIANFGLALIATELGHPLVAAQHLTSSLDTDPDFCAARFELALNFFKRGMNANALSELNGVAARQSDLPELRLYRQAINAITQIRVLAPESEIFMPLFLLAPVARCGSTVLQRLVTSSGKIAIFGENLDLTKRLPECVEASAYKVESQPIGAGSGQDYFNRTLQNFFKIIRFYHNTASKTERAWGLKDPYSGQMGMLRNLLPSAKFIFLYRNLFDVARSYKARGWIKTKFDTIKLAHDWQDEIRKAFLCGDHNILVVRYENLVAESESSIRKIEDFIGLGGIKHETLKIKLNNAGENYLSPQMLTEQEEQLLREHAATMLSELNYL